MGDNPQQLMRIETAWNAWVPQADFDGVSDFYGLQSLAVNSLVAAGEVFIVARHGQPGDAVPVQFQMLKARCCRKSAAGLTVAAPSSTGSRTALRPANT